MENVAKRKIPVITPLINFFKNFHKRFKEGSLGTKLSHFVMGSGNFYHKQYVKGALYLVLQVAFILFMVLCPVIKSSSDIPLGYKAILNLKDLGKTDEFLDPIFDVAANGVLMLLFGIITLGVVLVYLFAWMSSIKSSFKADLDVKEGKKPTTFKEDLKSLLDDRFHVLMLTPTCLAALIFTILPTIFMICIAFTDYNTFSTSITWSGISGFFNEFKEGEIGKYFLPVLSWTFIWALIATFSNYFGGILLALLINKKEVKLKKVWRTIFILTIAIPQFISLLAVAQILSLYGPFNGMLTNLYKWTDGLIGLKEPIQLLGKAEHAITAKITILIVNLWVGIPYTMLQTSGILMNIPTDLYEAATIDGANKRQMFFKITLPYIIFVTTPYLIGSFVGNINSFNIIFFLTGGGPMFDGSGLTGQTDLLVTWLYRLTIENDKYNLGSIIGILTFLVTSSITLVTYRRSKAYKEEDTFQ